MSPAAPSFDPTSTGSLKREAIVEAALALFVERGFYGTAVPEIAARANVGAGTIYRYFDSKEALVNALYRQEKMRFAHEVIDDFPVAATTRAQFELLFARMARFTTAHPAAFVFMELHHHAPYLDAESRAYEERLAQMFTVIVERAQARKEIKAGDPRLLMGVVTGAFVGVVRAAREAHQPLAEVDWALAERCLWEAIRA